MTHRAAGLKNARQRKSSPPPGGTTLLTYAEAALLFRAAYSGDVPAPQRRECGSGTLNAEAAFRTRKGPFPNTGRKFPRQRDENADAT